MAEQHSCRTPTIAAAATDVVAVSIIQPAAMPLLQTGQHKCQSKRSLKSLREKKFYRSVESYAARIRSGSATLAVK